MGNLFCMANPPGADVVPYHIDRVKEFESKLVLEPSVEKAPAPPVEEDIVIQPAAQAEVEVEEENGSVLRTISKRLITEVRREQLKRLSSKRLSARKSDQLATRAMDFEEGDFDFAPAVPETAAPCITPELATATATSPTIRRSRVVELKDAKGEAYFYDLKTREITWERPVNCE